MQNCSIHDNYIHNVGVLLHADAIQTGGVAGLSITNNLITFGDFITADGFTLTNNVFFGSASGQVNCGGGSGVGYDNNSQTATLANNTLGLGATGGLTVQDSTTYGSFSVSNTVTYLDTLAYTYVTASDYNDLWNWGGPSFIASAKINGTNTFWSTFQDINGTIGFEGLSYGGAPQLTNAPYA